MHNVNSMSFILRFGLGKNGDWAIGGAPMMRRMSSLRWSGHLHLGKEHMHGNCHEGMMFLIGLSLILPASIWVKHHMVG